MSGRPDQHHAVVDRRRGRRIVLQANSLGDPEGLAGRDVADHDLLAGRRGLGWRGRGRAAARRTSARLRPARKWRLFLAIPRPTGFAQDLVEVGRLPPANRGKCATSDVSTLAMASSALRNLDREYRQRSSLNLRWRNECPPLFP